MDKDIQQLVEMGATVAQARAALRQYRDIMAAAEQIFEGNFDNVMDEDMEMDCTNESRPANKSQRMATPDEEGDVVSVEEDEDGMDDYVDYDSDDEFKAEPGKPVVDIDPYAGVFFSKDRREEVIEVEEDPESFFVSEWNQTVKLMTQGEWMKGSPEGGEQSFLFSLYSQLSQGECPCPHDCGELVTRRKSDFFTIAIGFDQYTERLRRIVPQTCCRCAKHFCLACGESIGTDVIQKTSTASEDVLFHCSNLQGVILGIGLSMVEHLYFDQIHEDAGEQDSQTKNSKKRKMGVQVAPSASQAPDDDDEVYYASSLKGKRVKNGTGYAGDVREDVSKQIKAQAIQRVKDEKLGRLLAAVRWYLPSLRRPGGGRTSDYLVHPTALAHLRRRFNHVCSSLLKNDSLADMSDRSVLYHELFDWLETISHHEALASIMAMPIMIFASVKAVTTKKTASKGNHPIRERTIVYEGSSGPRELLESVVIQAQAAMKGLEGMKAPQAEMEEMSEEAKRVTNNTKGKMKESDVPVSDDSQKLLDFCRRIIATANAIDRFLLETKGDAFMDRLRASLPNISASVAQDIRIESGATEESMRKVYVDWAARARFEYCDLTIPDIKAAAEHDEADTDQTPNYKFYYNNEARMLANCDIPKRSLAIAKELAVLTTNLPVAWDSSIFLRVDETRVDIIKALITGPEGTPYHNGCFLFDIFLGPTYNQSPPSVKYMTTHGGKFRFNPNLYADGKVCLSLLGTWTGPGWVAGKSTLLQVLISIQSMILCDEPYLNEPAWAGCAGTLQSQAYSANIRRMVVKTAMLANLKNPPEPFGDIIRTHFRLKAKAITEQLNRWLSEDDGRQTASDGASGPRPTVGGSSNGFQNDVEETKEILAQLNKSSTGDAST